MPRITRDEVERIAALARLSLAPDEAERMTTQLGALLDYVALLGELDTRDIEPTSHPVPIATPLREDRAGTPLAPDLALANAPESEGGAFRVPPIIEGGE